MATYVAKQNLPEEKLTVKSPQNFNQSIEKGTTLVVIDDEEKKILRKIDLQYDPPIISN